jgi:tRNA A-37 threonylcarbamoyl transferase component Bud32
VLQVHDIGKGMNVIHSHPEIRSHGNLKSSNCVVNSRLVLRITDFGLHQLRDLQDKDADEVDFKSNSEFRRKSSRKLGKIIW